MRAMIIDGGGRGQALAAKLEKECDEIYVSPGNPGNEHFAYSTGIPTTDIGAQLEFAENNRIDVTIVGNDDPLALGIVDVFQAKKQAIFGPTRQQARIEWDKGFAKRFSSKYGIPAGPYAYFEDSSRAIKYAINRQWPLFVKDNDLAQGKGVKRCENLAEFEEAVSSLGRIVVEDYIPGPEASHHAFCDGSSYLTVPFLVRDHKQAGEHDIGPMAGGMGAVGPLPEYLPVEVQKLSEKFVEPIVKNLGFRGVLFSGLKGYKNVENNLEWNARPGDPETQVFMQLIKSELLPIIWACIDGKLDSLPPVAWHSGRSVACLALCAEGYPTNPRKGAVIEGIEELHVGEQLQILHAGTRKDMSGRLVVNGGRVLNIVAHAESLELAIDEAYKAADSIAFGGKQPVLRRDIGRTSVNQKQPVI